MATVHLLSSPENGYEQLLVANQSCMKVCNHLQLDTYGRHLAPRSAMGHQKQSTLEVA